jgi:plastocyanin domain-containing protein
MKKPILAALALLCLAGCSAPEAPEEPEDSTLAPDGKAQMVTIHVDHGYSPNRIRLQPNLPTRLIFVREEATDTCAKDLVIPGVNVKQTLPNHQETIVELPPQQAGATLPFHCDMNMMKGLIEVSSRAAS